MGMSVQNYVFFVVPEPSAFSLVAISFAVICSVGIALQILIGQSLKAFTHSPGTLGNRMRSTAFLPENQVFLIFDCNSLRKCVLPTDGAVTVPKGWSASSFFLGPGPSNKHINYAE